MRNKDLRRVYALFLLFALVAQLGGTVRAADDQDTVYIGSAEELCSFARKCAYDVWSEGKTVILQRDISLGGVEFTPIPSFGGTFEGNGHTISNLSVSAGVSPAGLFGIVAPSGVVRELTVEGTVDPEGSAKRVGGIAGENHGTVSNCVFTGTVNGAQSVGGIVGLNAAEGVLRRCEMNGGVFGKAMTGGVAGENRGTLSYCTNRAYVNTNTLDPSISADRLEVNMTGGLLSLISPDTFNVATDSGGVAGYSDGSLLGCVNHGTVGYQHIGYNVGGIVGRSSGNLSACVNHGSVYGRREVGGVAGMAEPYVHINLKGGSLDEIREQVRALSRVIDKAADDASNTSGTISDRLDEINRGMDDVSDRAETLSDHISDLVDDEINEVNRGVDILDETLNRLDGVTKELTDASESLGTAVNKLSDAERRMERDDVSGDLTGAGDDLRSATGLISDGTSEMKSGLQELRSVRSAVRLLPTEEQREEMRKAIDRMIDGFELMLHGRKNTDGTRNGQGVHWYLDRAQRRLNNALRNISGDWEKVLDDTADATNKLTEALRDTETLLDYLNAQEKLRFRDIGTETDGEADALYDSLHGVSNNLDLLNQEAKSSSDVIVDDVREINRSFTTLMDTLLDVVEDTENYSADSMIEDTSDENVDAVVQGKLHLCRNDGTVNGDYDVGGIAGAMMVFNELDPESDYDTLSTTLRKRYELKCVLQECVNSGEIIGKEDNIGAVCGSALLGVISGCEAYGSVNSDGDCVGGVAGFADNIVRGSWAKCRLSGAKYVGGVVGGGRSERSDLLVTDCRSMVEITGSDQYAGAVIGADFGTLRDNRFVSDTLAGIDQVSRRGEAEPIDYETLLTENRLPEAFRSLTLSFVADDQVIRSLRVSYGDSPDSSAFPAIPQHEGEYARWDREDLSELRFDTIVTAVYAPNVTAVASDVTRSASRVAFLVEGAFTDRDTVEASPAIYDFDDTQFNPFNRLRAYRRTLLEQWQLKLPEDGSDTHIVRYLPPEGTSEHVELYLMGSGGWERVLPEAVGSYLAFSVPGNEVRLSVISTVTPWWVWLLAGCFALTLLAFLLVQLLHKVTRKPAAEQPPEDAAAAALRKKKSLRSRMLHAAAVLALGVILLAVLRFAPVIRNGVGVYSLLRHYAERDDSEIDITLRTELDGNELETKAKFYTLSSGDKKVSCVSWQDIPVYFCEDVFILENGHVYRASGALPNFTQMLRLVAGVYNASEITISEENGVTTYHAVAQGDEAARLMELLLADYGALPGTEGVTLELVVKDGELSSLNVRRSGEAGEAEAQLLFHSAEKGHALPQAVRAVVEAGSFEHAEDISEDARRLLIAWLRLSADETLSAKVTLSAECASLLLDEDLLWKRMSDSVHSLTRSGTTIFYTADRACTDAGVRIAERDALDMPEQLMRLAYEAILLGKAECRQSNSGWRYTIDADEATRLALASVIAPESGNYDLTLNDGSVVIELTGNRVSAVSLQSSGTVNVVDSEVAARFSARLGIQKDAAVHTLPETVRKALST